MTAGYARPLDLPFDHRRSHETGLIELERPLRPERSKQQAIGEDRRILYTIGHSTRPVSEFIEILRASAITRVVDIRRIPWSRTNPQFDMAVLPKTLGRAGLDYVHLAALGGLRGKGERVEEELNAGWVRQPFRNYADYARTPPFRDGLRELLEMASRQTCVIMCAEAVWWRCHRRIVTDYVLAYGLPVVHLYTRTTQRPAALTPFAVVEDDAAVSYPAPEPSTSPRERELTLDRSTRAPVLRSFALPGRRR
jgi:hypothetical protein